MCTCWGQFIDHDITANTDRQNTVTDITVDDPRPLEPEDRTVPLIGDGRNDENLIVAQFHVAFLRFHNAVVEWVLNNAPYPQDDRELFERARDLVRWHYQWLVGHDYLRTVTLPGVVDKVLLGGNRHFGPRDGEVYMPLEFSVAAYRFGHSMVRGFYDYNRNFGRKDGGPGAVIPFAPFRLVFAVTGSARPEPFNGGGTLTLPFNWVIEWNRFVAKGDSLPDHFARKIDTQLTPPLFDMINQISADAESLPEQVAASSRPPPCGSTS